MSSHFIQFMKTCTPGSMKNEMVPFHNMGDPIFDYQFRLILTGDTTVGKTTLLRYFAEKKFSQVQDPTIGVDFCSRMVLLQDDEEPTGRIKLHLWDTAGQERFRSITKSYYRSSVGAIVCYDITNRSSFEAIPEWMEEAKSHMEHFDPVFMMVGCKADLEEKRKVTKEEAFAYAQAQGIHYLETSSKTGQNIEGAFQLLSQEIFDKVQTGRYKVDDTQWDGIKSGKHNRPALQSTSIVLEGSNKSKCCF